MYLGEMKGLQICLILFLNFLYLIDAQKLNFKFYKHPDVDLTLEETIRKYGYPLEVHNLVTKDSYKLKTFRIPHGRNNTVKYKTPVLLVHGMAGCADNFITSVPHESLGYYLANKGYDVWIMSNRGSVYAREHEYLDPDKDKKYWDFSWHEIAVIDIPLNVDYILNQTNSTSVYYVGHSQGTTTYFAFLASLPEYNDKIKLAIQLAPSCLLRHFKYPIFNLLAKLHFYFHAVLKFLRINEVFPQNPFVISIFRFLCSEMSIMTDVCNQVLYFGKTSPYLDPKTLQIIFKTSPAGFSVRQLIHYLQIIDSGNFSQYDYGKAKNLRRYKSKIPPRYNLTNCRAPVSMFYSLKDSFSPKTQVEELETVLPNIYENYEMPYEDFSHIDFIFSINQGSWVGEPIHQQFQKIDQNPPDRK